MEEQKKEYQALGAPDPSMMEIHAACSTALIDKIKEDAGNFFGELVASVVSVNMCLPNRWRLPRILDVRRSMYRLFVGSRGIVYAAILAMRLGHCRSLGYVTVESLLQLVVF